MKNKQKKYVFVEEKYKAKRNSYIQIVKQENKTPLRVQKGNGEFLIETRICKDYPSVYVNSPSREIKKWFELRKI